MAATSLLSSIGFSIKSSAPALMAATAMAMSACPEMITAGIAHVSAGQLLNQLDAVHSRHPNVGDDAADLTRIE